MIELTKKELFIKKNYKLEDYDIISIRETNRKLNEKKFTVWFAKIISNGIDLDEKYSSITDIVDWAKSESVDIMKYSFESALEAKREWHENKIDIVNIKSHINSHVVDKDRVVYITSDGKFFFYILKDTDIKYESKYMEHCIGWENSDQDYGYKIRSGRSIILSLRDEDNIPHLTIEIDVETGMSLQIKGKKNREVIDLPKYIKKSLAEFVIYSGNMENMKDKEIIEKINQYINFF